MSKNGIFIGRFQPAHRGHIHALSIAASQVATLYIFVGSANQCRSIKNPWTYAERVYLLRTMLRSNGVSNIEFVPMNDYPYSDTQWITDIRSAVEHLNIGTPILFGHMKEGNTYLKWFPDWEYRNIESTYSINATKVRLDMFNKVSSEMPSTVHEDNQYYSKEKELFANYPFKESLNFNCADAILECQGHILLIQRGRAPGKGSWALPGGFKNANETFLDCAIRELIEETNIRVPEKVLRGSIVKTQLFDSPSRSFGIPRNTLAVYMRISANTDGSLPRANGADDAVDSKWVTLSDALNNYALYDDHKGIISVMTGVMPMPAFLNIK
jgi:bifunctional NMN adenylyltransferase/nudix hydrolase